MATPKGLKRVVYFLDPSLVTDVKIIAAASDRDQSQVIRDAVEQYITSNPKPRFHGKPMTAQSA